jgi:ABC-type polysaccharide/polyol phosphate transport system ATPase subunit
MIMATQDTNGSPSRLPDNGRDRPAIQIEDVSVLYRLPHEQIHSFKEYAICKFLGRITYRDVWALRRLRVDIRKGEVFGVIGRNGAGKSTLLKVIARVLRPTEGRVCVRGRVAPLLEVGAGFHDELTGRENIVLNASLLGHSRKAIRERLDAIVEFSELKDFIDAPIRTYSTGMVARLGFAVATAWDHDVLLVDEVLAVGDEPFQRKCIDRVRSFQSNGTTIVLVSHNLALLASMCSRVLWQEEGRAVEIGDAASVIASYQNRSL